MAVRAGVLGKAGMALLLALPLAITAALAQSAPDRENGRYTFSQANDGSFLRLDTRTGNVSTCKRAAGGWACYLVPDERDAFDKEIGRLQADNARLKDELAKRDLADANSKTDAQLPKGDSLKPGDSAKAGKPSDKGTTIEVPLPSERDIDRVMALLEHAWRRLVEVASRMQRDATGKI